MNHDQGRKELQKTRIIAIIRGVEEKDIIETAHALLRGGITVMEVTLNTPGALQMIAQLQRQLGEQMYIGAGTVLDVDDARLAIEAGASFLVTPNTDVDAIRYSVSQGIPIYPGAMTPSEIVQAWRAGATAVKIFPGASLGIAYIKELQGPLGHIPMVAVGGVNEGNIADFLNIQCYALGIGGSLINLQEITRGNFQWITDKARSLIQQVEQYKTAGH